MFGHGSVGGVWSRPTGHVDEVRVSASGGERERDRVRDRALHRAQPRPAKRGKHKKLSGGQRGVGAVVPRARGCRQQGAIRGLPRDQMELLVRGGRPHAGPPIREWEIHLVEALIDGGDLAGEGNGGVAVPAVGLARDGIATAAAVLELLARSRKPLSTLCAELPSYARRRSTLPCDDANGARVALETLAAQLGTEPREPTAGVRVEVGRDTWGLVRLSATEPVLRITAEAPTQREADDLHAELSAAMADSTGSS